MQHHLSHLNSWLEARFTLLIMIVIILGIVFPGSAQGDGLVPWFIGLIMFFVALRCQFKDVLEALRSPKKISLLLGLTYLVMPVMAWFIARLFYFQEPQLAAGFILLNALPVAATVPMWTSIAKGDVALGLTAVSLTTLLSGLFTPLILALLVGTMIDFDLQPLITGLFKTVMIPVVLGMSIGARYPTSVEKYNAAFSLAVKPFMLGVLLINSAVLLPFLEGLSLWALFHIYLTVLLLMIAGYVLGFAICKVLGLDYATAITLTYAGTMRNNGAGIVIATGYFSPMMALPVTINVLIQQPLASMIYKLYSYWITRKNIKAVG